MSSSRAATTKINTKSSSHLKTGFGLRGSNQSECPITASQKDRNVVTRPVPRDLASFRIAAFDAIIGRGSNLTGSRLKHDANAVLLTVIYKGDLRRSQLLSVKLYPGNSPAETVRILDNQVIGR